MTSGSCLDGLSLALSQISFAVTELSKKNFKNNVHELKSVSTLNMHGSDTTSRLKCSRETEIGLIHSRGLLKPNSQVQGK